MGRRKKKLARKKLDGHDKEKSEAKMAQEELAGKIKALHWQLRKKFRINDGDYETVWAQHRADTDSLRQYANAMHTLATKHWDAQGDTRIHWCRNIAVQFFYGDGLRLALEKDARRKIFFEKETAEKKIMVQDTSELDEKSSPASDRLLPAENEKSSSEIATPPGTGTDFADKQATCVEMKGTSLSSQEAAKERDGRLTSSSQEKGYDERGCNESNDCGERVELKPENYSQGDGSQTAPRASSSNITHPFTQKICLLDVGSCYNPFQHFEEFQSFAIDLCPATPSVHQCDFLQLQISDQTQSVPWTDKSKLPLVEDSTNLQTEMSSVCDSSPDPTHCTQKSSMCTRRAMDSSTAASVCQIIEDSTQTSSCNVPQQRTTEIISPSSIHSTTDTDHTHTSLIHSNIGTPQEQTSLGSSISITEANIVSAQATTGYPSTTTTDIAVSETMDSATNNTTSTNLKHKVPDKQETHSNLHHSNTKVASNGISTQDTSSTTPSVVKSTGSTEAASDETSETNNKEVSFSPPVCSPVVTQLPACSFHCVVFSLLLEYMPACQQRLLCCLKAHQLLALNGLLIIVTPDSHSQHRNAPMMKSWKEAIESLGFKRWKYEKQCHLHGMAFRKVTQEIKLSESEMETIATKLYIPQDFKDEPDEPPPKKKKKTSAGLKAS